MSYITFGEPLLNSDQSKLSMQNLQFTKTEWIALVVTWYQDTINSTEIRPLRPMSYTDEELFEFLLGSLSMGYEIFLKPHVDTRDGRWRALIGSEFSQPAMWEEWFKSYSAFILRYAEIAQRFELPLFSVGVEMISASSHEKEFRNLILDVKKVYKGNITYAANWGTVDQVTFGEAPTIHGEIDDIKWLDALDILGVDAYYYLTDNKNPSKDELMEAWSPIRDHLANISTTYKKSIIFTEIGYRSIEGAAVHPGWWNGTAAVNETQQELCYDAVFSAFQDQSWWEGVYWWNWYANPNAGGPNDQDFTPQNKLAEDLVTKYYSDDYSSISKEN